MASYNHQISSFCLSTSRIRAGSQPLVRREFPPSTGYSEVHWLVAMAEAGETGEAASGDVKLERTPTWIVASVCFVIIIVSLIVERLLHHLGKVLKRKNQKPLFDALQKVKEELMLLGFISLLLTVLQGVIQKICIPEQWNHHMLPCKMEDSSDSHGTSHFQTVFSAGIFGGRRRLLSGDESGSDHCSRKWPRAVGRILVKKCYLLENFFQGNDRRIFLWFDHFAGVGESGHRKGARALSLYAFANRDVCWEELEWKGKHGQSPAVVGTKPHYFQDLDILQTIQNFLDYVPDFWSSDELAESVKDGEILKIDTAYFVDRFSEMMYEEELEEVWEIIEEFILEEEFSSLSQSLLILLDQESLLFFLKIIGVYIKLNAQCQDYAKPSCWLEILLSACIDQISSNQISLDELVLLNAVIANSRQLLRLVSDEEHEEEKGKIAELLKTKVTLSDADHWAFIIECKSMKLQEATKFAGLLSWVLYYCLSEECMVANSWETLFNANGITFRKADDYSFVHADGSEEGCDSDSGVESGSSIGKRKKKRNKKKRKKHHFGDDNLDETIGMGTTEQTKNSGSRWFLSTDDSSCAWNTADLPEHLGRHCFKTWMKWIYSKD